MALLPFPSCRFLNSNPKSPYLHVQSSVYQDPPQGDERATNFGRASSHPPTLNLHTSLVQPLAASAILFLALRSRPCISAPLPLPVATSQSLLQTVGGTQVTDSLGAAETVEDKELRAAFERWKSKTYALTVPLRIVALRGSIPPSWIKDFVQVQGRRMKLLTEFRGSLENIFSDLSLTINKGHLEPKSVMAADVVTIGDSWLSLAISRGLIEPMKGVEEQDWFRSLNDKWKVYLRRNNRGMLDSDGDIWGAPYRWGCMVVAYKKNKFQKHNLDPIEYPRNI